MTTRKRPQRKKKATITLAKVSRIVDLLLATRNQTINRSRFFLPLGRRQCGCLCQTSMWFSKVNTAHYHCGTLHRAVPRRIQQRRLRAAILTALTLRPFRRCTPLLFPTGTLAKKRTS